MLAKKRSMNRMMNVDAVAIVAPTLWKRIFPRPPTSKHGQHNRVSLLKYLFPNAAASVRTRLDRIRNEHFPGLRHRAQSSIYRYLVNRQLRKQKRKAAGFLSRLRFPKSYRQRLRSSKDALALQRRKTMSYPGSSNYADLSGFRSEGREPGARRKKLAGYLKAANEVRQSYFSGADTHITREGDEGHDSAFPDAAIVRSGNEEMVLFPSYARRHVKSKTNAADPGEGNDADYWRRAWDRNESDKAIVDVDVRGWLYTPQKGQLTRKHRLLIGVARQILGLPAPPAGKSGDNSSLTSREASPNRQRQEEDLINLEAEELVQRGNAEAEKAQKGAFSEKQYAGSGSLSPYSANSRETSPERGRNSRLSQVSNISDDPAITPVQKRSSWPVPGKMSAAELATANAHLLTRLKPFMSVPLVETPISAFFYNESVSRQRTVYTDTSGHFTCRAPLDFVPTHVRVLAGEKLSATDEVHVTSEKGVSLISDIDDTIKHSNITGGAREIFRNAFIRDLGDLVVDGVKEWYTTLHDMGVKLHYVSNSPWQMYPILSSYFKMAHLPKGSFHLKQYGGPLQGIFEPVAERKKANLAKLLRDFPERKFILVGDSGEADLEVYTDVVLDNPGRVLGVFIRDVTTSAKSGYFDPSGESSGGSKSNSRPHSRNHSRNKSSDSLAMSKRLSRPMDVRDDDPELKAAIAASLQDMEAETRLARRSINPDMPVESRIGGGDGRAGRPPLPQRLATSPGGGPGHFSTSPEEDLIDFSEDLPPAKPWMQRNISESNLAARRSNGLASAHKHIPSPPPKPSALRSPSPNGQSPAAASEKPKPPPPRPRKPSSTVKPPSPPPSKPPHLVQHSPLSQVQRSESTKESPPPLPSRPNTYRGMAKQKVSSVYNAIPSAATAAAAVGGTYWQSADPVLHRQPPSHAATQPYSTSRLNPAAPPPPAPRRVGSTQSLATIRQRHSGAWSDEGLGSPGESVSKKEQLWNQRWSRAKGILERQGVTLRSWRVGADVADVCVKLVEMEMRKIEREERAAR